MNQADPAVIGILTVSDRASRGEYVDLGGPAIEQYFDDVINSPWQVVRGIVPDEVAEIKKSLVGMCDDDDCCLIVTTGGTGPALRDVTPEATESVCQKMMPGFGELMRAVSLKYVSTAILSRQTAGIRGRCLILNLPGKPKSIAQCLDAVMPAIPYCIDLLEGPYITTDPARLVAFRPKSK